MPNMKNVTQILQIILLACIAYLRLLHLFRLFSLASSPVFLSTLPNGDIVRGLEGVPPKGPVLLVGYHMLMGLELGMLYKKFLEEKKVILHGLAHPIVFSQKIESSRQEVSQYDNMNVYGGIPVNPMSMYRLFQRGSFVLLYPGGAREALHKKVNSILSDRLAFSTTFLQRNWHSNAVRSKRLGLGSSSSGYNFFSQFKKWTIVILSICNFVREFLLNNEITHMRLEFILTLTFCADKKI
jgi:hypothetical protein